MKTDLATNLRAIVARAYVRVVAVNRQAWSLVADILFPLAGVAAYVMIYRAMGAPRHFESLVILGGAMVPFWHAVLWGMASQFAWERKSGNLELYLAAPISRLSILLGMASGSMITMTLRSAAVIALGAWVFGVPLAPVSWPLLAGAFLLTLLPLYALGMLCASLFLVFGREAEHLVELAEQPVVLLSGFFFPVRALGQAVALGASVIPLTLGLDAMRQVLLGRRCGPVVLGLLTELAILAAQAVVYFVLATRALALMEARAKREGRLTLRWQ